MRNLKPYTGNDFQFHRSIIDSKRDPTYKARVSGHNLDIEVKFDEFRNAFHTNSLHTLSNHAFSEEAKADILNLYSYKSQVIQKLKIKITTTESNRILNTCQNCTISEINSFDHFIPKEEFCEFVVNPKNLFPSCTVCNSHKHKNWKDENDNFLFLNLYLDILPSEQYLFVNLELEDDVIKAKFSLDNPNNIDNDFYRLIVSHYTRLHLLERFNKNVDSVITPLENLISSSLGIGRISIDEMSKIILETSEKNKQYFGHNYWKSILETALISNDAFVGRFA